MRPPPFAFAGAVLVFRRRVLAGRRRSRHQRAHYWEEQRANCVWVLQRLPIQAVTV